MEENLLISMEPILKKRVTRGGIIALIIITVLLIIIGWDTRGSKLWMIIPLILVTLAGSAGGYAFHRFDELQQRQRISETLSWFLSILVYLILLLFAFAISILFWD